MAVVIQVLDDLYVHLPAEQVDRAAAAPTGGADRRAQVRVRERDQQIPPPLESIVNLEPVMDELPFCGCGPVTVRARGSRRLAASARGAGAHGRRDLHLLGDLPPLGLDRVVIRQLVAEWAAVAGTGGLSSLRKLRQQIKETG